jgi:hypothetical protein
LIAPFELSFSAQMGVQPVCHKKAAEPENIPHVYKVPARERMRITRTHYFSVLPALVEDYALAKTGEAGHMALSLGSSVASRKMVCFEDVF